MQPGLNLLGTPHISDLILSEFFLHCVNDVLLSFAVLCVRVAKPDAETVAGAPVAAHAAVVDQSSKPTDADAGNGVASFVRQLTNVRL